MKVLPSHPEAFRSSTHSKRQNVGRVPAVTREIGNHTRVALHRRRRAARMNRERSEKFSATPILVMVGVLIPRAACAQTACPQGMTPGSSQCLSTGSAATGSPPSPESKWRTTWGAFASDAAAAVTGTSSDQPSRRAANAAAVAKCKAMGGGECKVTLAYENQCAVIAQPVDNLASFSPMHTRGPTVEVASSSALKECALVNQGHACKVIYSNCTHPVLVN